MPRNEPITLIEWANALDNYEQCSCTLKDPNGCFCVVGVLCDLYDPDGWYDPDGVKDDNDDHNTVFRMNDREWGDDPPDDLDKIMRQTSPISLYDFASLNDDLGWSFKKLKDFMLYMDKYPNAFSIGDRNLHRNDAFNAWSEIWDNYNER